MDENLADETEDLSCIHWGYLNIMQLNDVTGRKVKHFTWQTFWTDLCGSTLRLYKDISLPSNQDFPPATVIEPRPEDQIKHAFFCLKNGIIKDFDTFEYFQKAPRRNRAKNLARKNTLQIILADSSVYFLQAPTMSALYRWQTKIQSSIDSADAPELYDKRLRDARMAMYQRRRCFVPPEPTYPESPKQDILEEEEFYVPERKPCDPRIEKLKEKLLSKRRLLNQLERQEKDFLGADDDNKSRITRIEFEATAKLNYLLVPGRRETLIEAGESFSVFGRLSNGRWRCFVDKKDDRGTSSEVSGKIEGSCHGHNGDISGNEEHGSVYSYPLIGCVPTSAIVELCQPSNIREIVDSMSLSFSDTTSELSPPGTPPPEILTSDTSPGNTLSQNESSTSDIRLQTQEPYSLHKSPRGSLSAKQPSKKSDRSPSPVRPNRLLPPGGSTIASRRKTHASDSSLSPTSPRSGPQTPTQTISLAMNELNQALQSLNLLNQRTRGSSDVSTCSRVSGSSQEEDGWEMNRGSRLEVPSDESSRCAEACAGGVVRRTRSRDIHISRKLHAKGISLIVGSSSSSEDAQRTSQHDEEDDEDGKKEINEKQNQQDLSPSRKIEGLHASKEKLTEKGLKGPNPLKENTPKPTNGDRGNLLDKPTINNDLLREFSDNSCSGLPVRNSVTQAQFKPLASHEIPPPLHQRRTLQMTRKENEGFGFVLQTHTIVVPGAYSDSMTFVSNVSEDGPAYLAGMRPGDVIIEVENATVEDEDQQMIVESLKSAGLTVRLVVVYKDAIHRMRLSTRLMALNARLQEAEAAYEALESKERTLKGRVKDPSAISTKVRVALIHIHIQIASSTFARDSPLVKNTVVQKKKTPTELLQVKQPPSTSDLSRLCGVATAGYELVREFSSTCDSDSLERHGQATSPKYASDPALNFSGKKRKISDGSAKQKTLKYPQRSSFISYVDLGEETTMERRRIRSEGCDSENELDTSEVFTKTDGYPRARTALTSQPSVSRPQSYMFAVGSQNALCTGPVKGSHAGSRIPECTIDQGFV